MKRIGACLFCVLFLGGMTFVCAEEGFDENGDGKVDKWIETDAEGNLSIKMDTDADGIVDYFVKYSEDREKILEEMDYNHDGSMDDFYYYSHGVLERREIDSNADGKIDIWVFLDQGVYVSRYLWDKDFDGEVDLVKDFGDNEQS